MARHKGSPNTTKARPGMTSSRSRQSGIPDVYREMLADATSSTTLIDEEAKPVKRRRVAGRLKAMVDGAKQKPTDASEPAPDDRVSKPSWHHQQTAYDESSDSSDNDSENDMDWEEVDVINNDSAVLPPEDEEQHEELDLVLGSGNRETAKGTKTHRRPMSTTERKIRLDIHKMHILSLLAHIHIRNQWCNDPEIHVALKSILSSRIISYLNPDETLTQFQRSRSFVDGLAKSSEVFRTGFKTTARGINRSYWAKDSKTLSDAMAKDLELPVQRADFRLAAGNLEGSRDIGAQLYCALLRSAGVDARLVCSLQVLPFDTASKATTPQKATSTVLAEKQPDPMAPSEDEIDKGTKTDGSTDARRPVGSTGGRSRFTSSSSLMQQDLGALRSRRSVFSSAGKFHYKRIPESSFPIYWVEAFNEAAQKWIPVDPIVTNTVSKPSKLEPPINDARNYLTYVVAFEDDGFTLDVTRRYAKAFNAKTRKARVEATKDGEKWWRRVMKLYGRTYELARDQVEESQLTAREAAEGMPKNVLDFKDHPYYALERHLKRNEVVHPKREVGKVATGRSGGAQISEPIFRRRDVHVVKSADSWYRLGREIKIGEQPLKIVPARRDNAIRQDDDGDLLSADEGPAGISLYASHQTMLYSAPAVVGGRVPKNVYGNLDIYIPSMVPAGGSHIRHSETARAAQILGVDYSDAVTGFNFRGRRGTAIVTGAVVASVYREAILEVIKAIEDEQAEEEMALRSLEALKMWKRLLLGLRVRERIAGYEIEGERRLLDEDITSAENSSNEDQQGGFFPTTDSAVQDAFPTADSRIFENRKEVEFTSGSSQEGTEESCDSATDQLRSPIDDHNAEYYEDDPRGGFMIENINDDLTPATLNEEEAETSSPVDHITLRNADLETYRAEARRSSISETRSVTTVARTPNVALHSGSPGMKMGQGGERHFVDEAPYSTQHIKMPKESSPSSGLSFQVQKQIPMTPIASAHPASNVKASSYINTSLVENDPLEIQTHPPSSDPNLASVGYTDLTTLSRPSTPQSHDIPDQQVNMEQGETSGEEDVGSLLSCDPEEEDADPEWLM